MNNNKRGQAAMEFLMTYGWAILVVLAAVGALAYFGVLSPDTLLPERTTFQAPLPNVENAFADATENEVEISFTNNVGQRINLTNTANATVDEGGECIWGKAERANGSTIEPAHTISNGEVFRIIWDCSGADDTEVGSRFTSDDIRFEYTNMNTGSTRRHTGNVQARWS